MISFQIYEVRPDGTEWHSVPQEVREPHHVAQAVVAGYTKYKRAAIAPDGTLIYGLASAMPSGRALELKAWSY